MYTASGGKISGSIYNDITRSTFILGFFDPFDRFLCFSVCDCFDSRGGTFGGIFGLPFVPFNRAFHRSVDGLSHFSAVLLWLDIL